MKERVYGYSLRDAKGRRLYTGTTNNPRARRSEHKLAGKKFMRMKIETGPMSRADADAWERASLSGFRGAVGKNPIYNKTPDGQWKSGPRGSGAPESRPVRKQGALGPFGRKASGAAGGDRFRETCGFGNGVSWSFVRARSFLPMGRQIMPLSRPYRLLTLCDISMRLCNTRDNYSWRAPITPTGATVFRARTTVWGIIT